MPSTQILSTGAAFVSVAVAAVVVLVSFRTSAARVWREEAEAQKEAPRPSRSHFRPGVLRVRQQVQRRGRTRKDCSGQPSCRSSTDRRGSGVTCPYPKSSLIVFASASLSAGLPILDVSRLLGRKSITTTVDIYGHLLPDSTERGARALHGVLSLAAWSGVLRHRADPVLMWAVRGYAHPPELRGKSDVTGDFAHNGPRRRSEAPFRALRSTDRTPPFPPIASVEVPAL